MAGERPEGWGEDIDFRTWPPSPAERRRIDSEYSVALADAFAEEAARYQYETEREQWFRIHAPELVGRRPVHGCLIVIPETQGGCIEFEEFSTGGVICGGRGSGTAHAFGDSIPVIASAAGRGTDDPWVLAVQSALVRERAWPRLQRRATLEVKLANLDPRLSV